MPVEIIGIFHHRDNAEDRPAPPGAFGLQFLTELFQAHDRNGYDRILIANAATSPDSIPFAAYAAAVTKNLGFMIAHRPGFVTATMAARMLTTIDRLSQGRCAVHIITGANDKELQADGDFLTKVDRYVRSGEYVDVLRQMWKAETPFDHEGEYYRYKGAFSVLKPERPTGIPVYWAGTTPESIRQAARVADVYAMSIDSVAQNGATIEKVRAEAAQHGRKLGYCISFRIILGETEEEAWKKADDLLQRIIPHLKPDIASSVMSNMARRQEMIAGDDVLDERLWIGITKATLGTKAVSALVGTPDQVVDAMMKYYDVGITSFLFYGFDHGRDQDVFGRTVIPLLRQRVAEREAQAPKA